MCQAKFSKACHGTERSWAAKHLLEVADCRSNVVWQNQLQYEMRYDKATCLIHLQTRHYVRQDDILPHHLSLYDIIWSHTAVTLTVCSPALWYYKIWCITIWWCHKIWHAISYSEIASAGKAASCSWCGNKYGKMCIHRQCDTGMSLMWSNLLISHCCIMLQLHVHRLFCKYSIIAGPSQGHSRLFISHCWVMLQQHVTQAVVELKELGGPKQMTNVEVEPRVS